MENVFPMIPAGAAHNEMKLSDEDDKEYWQKKERRKGKTRTS